MNNYPKKIAFIFYHIEKCGGTSLRKFFNNIFIQNYDPDSIFYPEKNKNLQFVPENIEQIKQLCDYDNLTVILSHMKYNYALKSKIKISIIRNPMDRVLSHYYYFNYLTTNIHMIDLPEDEFINYCTAHGKLCCYSLGMLDNEDLDIKLMNQRINEFDFIATIENIHEDIHKIVKIIDNKLFKVDMTNINLEHLNVNKQFIKNLFKLQKKILPFLTYDTILYNIVKSVFK